MFGLVCTFKSFYCHLKVSDFLISSSMSKTIYSSILVLKIVIDI